MTKVRAAVFASGTGSNFEAIMAQHDNLNCEIALLVCDQPGAIVIDKAAQNQLAQFIFNPKDYQDKHGFEVEIVSKLREHQVDLVVLAGYMRLIGPTLLQPYQRRMINIHPSLLPAFPGLDAVGQALDAGVKISGTTIHYVDSGMDTGEIISQEPVRVESGMTKEELQAEIQKIEHELYPKTIQQLISKGDSF